MQNAGPECTVVVRSRLSHGYPAEFTSTRQSSDGARYSCKNSLRVQLYFLEFLFRSRLLGADRSE